MKTATATNAPHSDNVSALVPKLAVQILERAKREDMPKGYRLTEQALCDALGVSRSPVRKALQYLEAAGVLVSIPNRGFQMAEDAKTLGDLNGLQPSAPAEDIYMRIAKDRINGEIDPEVTEVDLMARYELARPQVQRVLNEMSKDGLVERKPGRGWAFRPILSSVESHRESYRFRMMIEPLAILEPGYAVNLAELEICRREQIKLLEGGIEKCTREQLFHAGTHFHETVVAGCGNYFALDSLRNVNRMRRVQEYGTVIDSSRLQRQCEEHLQLIDLLVRGERMEASNFMRQHLNAARITKVGNLI
ncbi:GntR family transcriptional regulator [Comamonas sp. Tr-654]|uniref:GntR family transcriptional regulator n=1 Tax=Comamonas sp. Tr-654 TaxID=2608341 RepID=UPI001422D44E|nr:GntR family transcriptional regulator [Comamonas sp. Tr-654]NIF82672.1 GntR family transcriptional regulator [Comamonas sp. Tr-654]